MQTDFMEYKQKNFTDIRTIMADLQIIVVKYIQEDFLLR